MNRKIEQPKYPDSFEGSRRIALTILLMINKHCHALWDSNSRDSQVEHDDALSKNAFVGTKALI